MSDELSPPSFLKPDGRNRVCMFSIMAERGRRAEEFRALGVETVFTRLGDGRYADGDADMMRGWLGHMAQEDVSLDVSERIRQIDARFAMGRRRHRRGMLTARVIRLGWPVLPLMAMAAAAWILSPAS